MIQIPLSAIPNQSLSIKLGDSQYELSLWAASGIMAVDIVRNGTPVILGTRAVAGYPLIPYQYLEEGNFFIDTMNDDLPDYTQFGVTQFLIYATQAELGALRGGN